MCKLRYGKRCGVWVLFVLLACSLWMNVFLAGRSRGLYVRLLEQTLDPVGQAQSRAFPAESSDDGVLLVAGDSRSAQWHFPEEFFSGVRVVNCGIGGQTTPQILARLPGELKRVRPQGVLIQAGVNNLKAIPLLPERKAEIIANCKTDLEAMIDLAAAEERQVIVSAVFPVGEAAGVRRFFWSDDVMAAVEEVNAFLEQLCRERGDVHWLSASALWQDNGKGIVPEYAADLLHLNAKGYRELNTELRALLETVGFSSD